MVRKTTLFKMLLLLVIMAIRPGCGGSRLEAPGKLLAQTAATAQHSAQRGLGKVFAAPGL